MCHSLALHIYPYLRPLIPQHPVDDQVCCWKLGHWWKHFPWSLFFKAITARNWSMAAVNFSWHHHPTSSNQESRPEFPPLPSADLWDSSVTYTPTSGPRYEMRERHKCNKIRLHGGLVHMFVSLTMLTGPDCMQSCIYLFHYTMDCCYFHPVLWLDGSDNTQLIRGSSCYI